MDLTNFKNDGSSTEINKVDSQDFSLLRFEKSTDLQKNLIETQNIARILKQIFDKNYEVIEGKKYIKAQGWVGVSAVFGYRIVISDIKYVEGDGVSAKCDVYNKNNELVSSQWGFAGVEELERGGNKKRLRFILYGLAQTRAVARALKNIFGFAIAFLGNEYEFSAADEMPESVTTKTVIREAESKNEEGSDSAFTKEEINKIIPRLKNGDIGESELEYLIENFNILFYNATDKQKDYILGLLKKAKKEA